MKVKTDDIETVNKTPIAWTWKWCCVKSRCNLNTASLLKTCDVASCVSPPADADNHTSTDQLEVWRLNVDLVALCWQAVPVSRNYLQSDRCVPVLQRRPFDVLQSNWHAQDDLVDSAHLAPSCSSGDTGPPYCTHTTAVQTKMVTV